jgi:transcriptional regulator with XRE-family HTH domain
MGLRASKVGLEIIDKARKKRGWTKSALEWRNRSMVGATTLKRFWRAIEDIQVENFQNICHALDIDWTAIVDWDASITPKESLLPTPTLTDPLPPFGDEGCIENPDRFFNRQALLNQVFEALKTGCSRSLVGESEIGKSSILSMICHRGPDRLSLPSQAFIRFDMQTFWPPEAFLHALQDALKLKLDLNSPAFGFDLQRQLNGRRYFLCLDEIEAFTDFPDYIPRLLRGLADGSRKPFTLVTASRSPLSQLFPDTPTKTSPLTGICQQIDVTPFDEQEAREFLQRRLQGTGITFTENEIAALVTQSGGHPARLQKKAALLYRQKKSCDDDLSPLSE